eukprot:1191572-Prorocentrum_minimum.AAC.3
MLFLGGAACCSAAVPAPRLPAEEDGGGAGLHLGGGEGQLPLPAPLGAAAQHHFRGDAEVPRRQGPGASPTNRTPSRSNEANPVLCPLCVPLYALTST